MAGGGLLASELIGADGDQDDTGLGGGGVSGRTGRKGAEGRAGGCDSGGGDGSLGALGVQPDAASTPQPASGSWGGDEGGVAAARARRASWSGVPQPRQKR